MTDNQEREAKTGAGETSEPKGFEEWVVRYLYRSRFAKVTLWVVLLFGVFTAIWSFLPESLKTRAWSVVVSEPEIKFSPSSFEIKERTTTINMQAWKQVPKRIQWTSRFSPMLYHTKYLIERKNDNSNVFINNHWTTGLAIDFACVQPDCLTKEVQGKYKQGDILYKKYELMFDVSDEVLYDPFNIEYQAVYWNSLQEEEGSSIGCTIQHPTRKLNLIADLIENVDTTSFEFSYFKKEDNNNFIEFENPKWKLSGRRIIWVIEAPKLDYGYFIKWKWLNPLGTI